MGGTDLSQCDRSLWRSGVALIDQEPKLFSRDIAANITYGIPDSTPEATATAAAQANAASFIDAFPEKFVFCEWCCLCAADLPLFLFLLFVLFIWQV